MNKLIVALALCGLGSVAHATAKGLVAPAPGTLKNYIMNNPGRLVKQSASPRSTFMTFNKALAAHPSEFRKLIIFHGIDTSEIAYIPKVQIKGLAGNTAYVRSFNLINHEQLHKVRLPLF